MERTTAPNSKDIKRTNQKTYVKLHSHKPEGRTHKSQTHTKQATRSCKTMLSNARQSRAEHGRAEQSRTSKVKQLLKIFCPPLNALNLN